MIENKNFHKVKLILETSPRMKNKDISKITNLSIVTITKILKYIENEYSFKYTKLIKKDDNHSSESFNHSTTQEP